MERMKSRLGWALAGALGIVLVLALARATVAGPLDPPGPVASTMRTIDELVPSWGKTLTSSGGCTSQRFTCVMGNAAVLDHETGLVWERVPFTPLEGWLSAATYCPTLDSGGRFGWRVPSVDELSSLLFADYPGPFDLGNQNGLSFWSTTVDQVNTSRRWVVDFVGTFHWLDTGSATARVWCVRGGASRSPQ